MFSLIKRIIFGANYSARIHVGHCLTCGYTIADPNRMLDPIRNPTPCFKCKSLYLYFRAATDDEMVKYRKKKIDVCKPTTKYLLNAGVIIVPAKKNRNKK
jgi:hypothetical protein